MSIYNSILMRIKRGLGNRGHEKIVSLRPRSGSNGRLLLSYLTAPFESPATLSTFTGHSNHWQCFQIGQVFLDLGYEVDVINWDDDTFPRGRNYSICIDIHHKLEQLAPQLDSACIKVLHITGAHWLYQNEAEYRRCLELQMRRHITVVPRRQVLPSLGIEIADYATLMGNDFTEGTFKYAGKKIFRIPVSTTATFPAPANKDFDRCRHRFIWLGGSGAVHKGLDRVLEAVASSPDIELIVCGPILEESDFVDAYSQELNRTSNIRTLGWVDITSPQFAAIVRDAVGLIYPTCSEGQAGSVIVALHAGLIPIVSRQAGVSVDEFGFVLDTCTVSEIRQCLTHVRNLPSQELARRAQAAWRYARANHTREAFKTAYRDAALQILKERAN